MVLYRCDVQLHHCEDIYQNIASLVGMFGLNTLYVNTLYKGMRNYYITLLASSYAT
jgi:hypothetical protein